MKLEFPRVFNELLAGAREKLINDITLKLEVIKISELENAHNSPLKRLKSIFASHLMGQMVKGMHLHAHKKKTVDIDKMDKSIADTPTN